jgi:hypothetical protein
MAKYIDKDALVAEINKRIIAAPINNIGHQRVWAYNDVKDIINTLEVKESLTWEDIRELYIIFAEVDVEIEFCKTDIQAETIGYYQEVLKRFKAQKVEL